MKEKQPNITKRNSYLIAICTFALLAFNVNIAYSQVDFTYGQNNSGFRLSAGPQLQILQTHFSENYTLIGFVGNLDYDINPYFSIGGEGQTGVLQGVDAVRHLSYYSSSNDFLTANLNFKVAVGLIADFESNNAFQDALKKFYIGAGVGVIKNQIVLSDYSGNSSKLNDHFITFPLNIGTNIDLRGILGNDRFAINPNYQFNIINSSSFDGIPASEFSKSQSLGFYSAFSIKLKYKF